MSTALDLVYRYRQLAGKCEVSGLTIDEIDLLNAIESLFASRGKSGDRRHHREVVSLRATVRGPTRCDTIQIQNLAPGGLVCRGAELRPGEVVEVIIDDEALALSYRFKAKATWVRGCGPLTQVGLRFLGTPVLLRFGARAASDVASAA